MKAELDKLRKQIKDAEDKKRKTPNNLTKEEKDIVDQESKVRKDLDEKILK